MESISNRNIAKCGKQFMLRVRHGDEKGYYVGSFDTREEAEKVYKDVVKNPSTINDYRFKTVLTSEIKEQIMDLFWDRNRTHVGPKPYDNSDGTIAKKVGISKYVVEKFIKIELHKHFNLVNFKVNKGLTL